MKIFSKTAIAVLLLISTLFAVSCSLKPIKSSKEEARVVARCDGHDIRYEQLRYSVVEHKKEMESIYGEGIWNTDASAAPYIEELRVRVEDDLKTYSTVLSVCNQYNIHINDKEIEESVQEEIENTVEICGGKKKYKQYLKEAATTDSVLRFLCGIYYCQNELFLLMRDNLGIISAPSDDSELIDLLKEEIYRVNYVYIPFSYGGNSKEQNKEKAESIYSRLSSEEIDFSRAIYEGGTDSTLSDGGNYYLYGIAPIELEEQVKKLDEGEFSKVFELDGAFYIVKRESVDVQYIMHNLGTLEAQYIQVQFNEILSEHKKGVEITYLEEFELHKIN